MVEQGGPQGRRQDAGVVANLAAASAAGLTLGSADLVFPLGWFGVIVATVSLVLGLAFGALALLQYRWGAAWRSPAPAARPASVPAAGHQPR